MVAVPIFLRADFLPASVLPFLVGAAYAYNSGFAVSISKFMLGLIGVASVHLSANLANDYYDYKSGADNNSKKVSSFFGGSRAIQEGLITDKEVIKLSRILMITAALCGTGIILMTKSLPLAALITAGAVLAVQYTAPPLRLAYNGLGELVIFLLFGPGVIMGSFYIFSGEFTFGSFFISLPVAFLIAGVIICNEVPDFKTDIMAGKRNLLAAFGIKNGYILYGIVIALSAIFLFLNIIIGNLPVYAVFIGAVYVFGIKAYFKLKNSRSDVNKLIQASRLTILQHLLGGSAIAAALLFT